MNIDEFFPIESVRLEIYQLLAGCYSIPDRTTLTKKASLIAALKKSKIQFEFESKLTTFETSPEDLLVDYSRLFVGPYKLLAPPYGSIYLDGQRQLFGDSTVDVQSRYESAGLQFSKDFREAPDHIAAELEFLYFLIFLEVEALEKENWEAVLESLKFQESFLNDHLGAWISRFASDVEENAQTEFYKNLAIITSKFVQGDLTNIKNSSIPQFGKFINNN
ncbi:MAG: molecular chaperone TorD family protein [Anaerolineales bacterium]|nr:molecular chaperone TorD family protein [Chloroflexota bacterium]MBL6983038.1 molecular chaperone TorD family protein [Anaerolineales bacterium]